MTNARHYFSEIADKTLQAVPSDFKDPFLKYLLTRRPFNFGIELTNICNADCQFCAYRYQTKPKGIISDEIFKRAVDGYCKIGGGDLELTPTVGEPLLDKKLLSRIRYARGKPQIKQIRFFTNLLLLHQFDLSEFLKSGISDIHISTCIKDEPTFRKIYRTSGYAQLLENIVNLCKANRNCGNPIKLRLLLRVPKPFESILQSADYKKISHYFDEKDIEISEQAYDSWSGMIKEGDLPGGQHMHPNPHPLTAGPCSELYRRINVLHDGRVNFCICRDLNGEFIIGNIMDEGILEIWHGNKMRRYREDWDNGIYPSMCLGCEKYEPLRFLQKRHSLDILKSLLH